MDYNIASSMPNRQPPFRWLAFHNVLLVFCVFAIAIRIYTIILGGGWADRAQFFGEGELRPSLVDFIYNEVMVNYLILRVIVFRPNPLVYLLIVVSAFAYFTRLPLTLLFFAFILSRSIKIRSKILLSSFVVMISFIVLYLRLGESVIYGEDSAIFYLTYPLIGVGRLLGTSQEYGVTATQYLSLFLKPLDALLFIVDYVGQKAGDLSTGRHVGLELSRFVYIQSLQGSYNAFGTILYPFVLIAGWLIGIPLFTLFILFQYLQYQFVTRDASLSRRYILLLLLTGILFSWSSPFTWLVPFLFFKSRHTVRHQLSHRA